MAMNITELHAENFEQEVVNADRPVCIDFWAPWCGPCRMLSPVIEELAAEEPAIKFCKVNVDDEPGLAAQFGVSSIPTLIFSKNGALTGRTVVPPKWALEFSVGAGGQVWDALGKGKHIDVMTNVLEQYDRLGTPVVSLFGEQSPQYDAQAYQLLKNRKVHG